MEFLGGGFMYYVRLALLVLGAYILIYLASKAVFSAYFNAKFEFVKKVANSVKEGVQRHGA